MGALHWHCRLCHVLTDNRVCWDCYNAHLLPCPRCDQPTPSITRMGRPAAHPTCTACTSHLTADAHRIGVTCRICGKRDHATRSDYQLCARCLTITAPCTACQQPMPKYRKKGLLRIACSRSCMKRLHPTTSAQAKQAGRTRFAGHAYKSSANRTARGRVEYREWRRAVYERDNYTCQDCHERGGELHPHHIQPFATYPELRYDASNGVTLCAPCHRKRHRHTFTGRSHKRAPGQLRLPIVAE